jgi:hypothetical protein
MHGAHCLDCRERGPDLVVTTATWPRDRLHGTLEFTCQTCGVRWRWFVTLSASGFTYGNPRHVTRTVATNGGRA